MEYQQLGSSELHISRIGFGCMSLKPGQSNVKYVLNTAVDAGINYFDTADLYDKGLNEEAVGEALKPFRNRIILATKVGNQWRPDGSGWEWNPRKDYILGAVEGSLRRLQTDYIDLYQLHGGTIDDPMDETIEAFELLQEQGKIRYYGISSIRPNVIREYVAKSSIVSVMMQFSLLDRRPAEACLDLLHEQSIGVLARGTIAGGLLTGKPSKPYLGFTPEEVTSAATAIAAASNDRRVPAQTAIQFALNHPAITAAVVGVRTMEQLNEAVGTIKAGRLTDEELKSLSESVPVKRYEEHR